MTPTAGLTLIGGGSAHSKSKGIRDTFAVSHLLSPRPATISPDVPEPPRTNFAANRLHASRKTRAFEQDPLYSLVRMMTDRAHAHTMSAMAHERDSVSHSTLAEARRSGRSIRNGDSHQTSRFSHRLRESATLRLETHGSEVPRGPNPIAVAEIHERRKRNRAAVELLETWLYEDAEVERDSWNLLKPELDRDRLSSRRLWF